MEICYKILKIYRPKIRSFVYSVGMLFLLFFQVGSPSRFSLGTVTLLYFSNQIPDMILSCLVQLSQCRLSILVLEITTTLTSSVCFKCYACIILMVFDFNLAIFISGYIILIICYWHWMSDFITIMRPFPFYAPFT